MARPGISRNEVFESANKLVGRGIEPTIELIRGDLGTGSNSTIAGFLREWRALQAKGEKESLNDNLPHEFIGLMKGLWQRLISQADNKIAAMQLEGEQMLAASRSAQDALKRDYAEMQQQYEQLKQEKTSLLADKLALEQMTIKKDREIISLRAGNDTMSAQLDEKQLNVEEMRRMHKQMQENLEHFRESTRVQRQTDQEKHAQQIQQIELSFKNTERQLAVANQDKMALQKQLDKFSNDNAMLEKRYDAINDKFDKLQLAFTSLEKEHDGIKRDQAQWQKQHEILQNKYDTQNTELNDQHKQYAIISHQLFVSNNELKDLKDQNKLLANEKWEIAQKKAQMEGQIRQMEKMMNA